MSNQSGTTESRTSESRYPLGALPAPQDFSLVLGGPLFQLLRRAHLSDDALMLVRQRIIVISLFAWLPLLVLSALEGQVLGGSVAVPFLLDVEVHVRFLVALPLLIVAELVVHQRMRSVVQQFLERNLIPESAMPRFEAAIASAFRLRNSVLAEVLLIAFVYARRCPDRLAPVHGARRGHVVRDAVRRRARQLSLAGMWYGYVSLPIFQFLLLPLVFSAVHLGALSLAGVTHRVEPGSHASGSRRRPGISFQHGLRLRPAGGGARRAAGRTARQPHFLPRGHTA